jgi:hypothetical protein
LPATDNRSGSGLLIGCLCCHIAKCCPSETRGNRCVSDCREIIWDVSANQPGGVGLHFFYDATINGCGVGVDSQYLGFIREYLAELTPNLNVFDTLPMNVFDTLPLAGMLPAALLLLEKHHNTIISDPQQWKIASKYFLRAADHFIYCHPLSTAQTVSN